MTITRGVDFGELDVSPGAAIWFNPTTLNRAPAATQAAITVLCFTTKLDGVLHLIAPAEIYPKAPAAKRLPVVGDDLATFPHLRLRDLRKTLLVFDAQESILVTMDKPWYRKFFSNSPPLVSPADKRTAVSADYEDPDVQFKMGLKFASPEGGAQDYGQAAEWYRKAAEQSHSLAQFNLGVMYAQGQGVAQDEAQSLVWFGKAAQQGDAGAQFHLGRTNHRASLQGTSETAPESRIEAYKWYNLAAAQGYRGSVGACTPLIQHMTREDVATGHQRVAAFAITHPNQSQGTR